MSRPQLQRPTFRVRLDLEVDAADLDQALSMAADAIGWVRHIGTSHMQFGSIHERLADGELTVQRIGTHRAT